jgi:hypothetical protein
MLVATEALRPPKLRIGKIGGNFTLPRTLPLLPLISGGLGALIFAGLFSLIVKPSLASIMYSATIGGVFGAVLVTYSPLRGESLLRWLGLKYKSSKNKTRLIDGKPVRLAVGICYVKPPISGSVGIRPGSIPVRPGLFDERGVRLREVRWVSERMLMEASTKKSRHVDQEPVEYTPRRPRAQNRLAEYKAASAEPALPDDMIPTLADPARRFGRWSQDAEELRRLYEQSGSPVSRFDDVFEDPTISEPDLSASVPDQNQTPSEPGTEPTERS